MQHCLLTDPVIRMAGRVDGVPAAGTLPEALGRLVADEVAQFPDLAPWQGHAWHAFLVQLAGLALHRGGRADPPTDAGEWADLLRGLVRAEGWDGGDEPWSLTVEDWTKPAFLQPPLPAATHKDLKTSVDRPDQLDVLITAKNHDVKAGRADRATPGQWIFALISLQTMQGFSGNTLYGIARMNGGFSSRPGIGIVPGPTPGSRFLRDLRVLMAHRDGLLWERGPRGKRPADWGYRDDGLGLVWLTAWDGASALGLSDLDPWFIEVCRRVRLVPNNADGGALAARTVGSKVARIDSKARNGNLGDPWTPIEKSSGKSLTVGGKGFHYDELSEILWSGDFQRPIMQQWHEGIDPAEPHILARVLVRGQGQTEGYHERLVTVPSSLRPGEGDEVLHELAQARIDSDIKPLQRNVLYPALRRILRPRDDDGGRLPPGENAWLGKWLDDLDRRIDRDFFDRLWPEALARQANDHAGQEAARREWVAFLRTEAEDVFNRALDAAPKINSRAYRARTQALGLFYWLLGRHLPQTVPLHDQEAAHG